MSHSRDGASNTQCSTSDFRQEMEEQEQIRKLVEYLCTDEDSHRGNLSSGHTFDLTLWDLENFPQIGPSQGGMFASQKNPPAAKEDDAALTKGQQLSRSSNGNG